MKKNKEGITNTYYIIDDGNTRFNMLQDVYNRLSSGDIDISSVNIVKCTPVKLKSKDISSIFDWDKMTRKHLQLLTKTYNTLKTNHEIVISCSYDINDYISKHYHNEYITTDYTERLKRNMQALFSCAIIPEIKYSPQDISFRSDGKSYYILFDKLHDTPVYNNIYTLSLKLHENDIATFIEISNSVTPDVKPITNFTKEDHDNIISLFKKILYNEYNN